VKLTDSAISKLRLPPGKDEIITFDSDLSGLGVRLRASGSKTWVFQYKLGSQHRRITLGKFPALHPTQARKTAAKLHAEVKLGNDPAAIKAAKQGRAAETVGAILKTYLTRRRGQIRDSSLAEIERHLQRNLAPLHGARLDQLDRRTIAAQLARLTHEAGPIQANRTRASLSKFLNWCLAEGLTESNAALHTNKNPEKSRDRVLSDQELREIWFALDDDGDYSAILKMLILTAQRASEIADLRWSEINLDRDIIVLPSIRTKNHRVHIVPITTSVRAILEARPRREGRDFVFGVGERGFSGWSKSKVRLDSVLNIGPFVVHDIRRSVATHMSEIGIPPFHVEAVLNHVSGTSSVAKIYNRNTFEGEKTQALTRWAEHLAALIDGRKSNITPLKRG
jgi:integrase